MSTGEIENWSGTIADIGPIYPFVGSEFALWVVGLVLWIVWHIVLTKRENQQFKEEIEHHGSKEAIKQALSKQ